MTKEEFGAELFDAISTCSRGQQLLKIIAVEVHKGRETEDLSAQYGREKATAKKLLTHQSISDADAARLMRQYPWLGH